MAGILGVVDLQQIRQRLGFSRFTIPTQAEIDSIRKRYFGSAPLVQDLMPTADQIRVAKEQVQASKTSFSVFYRKEGYTVGDLQFDLILSEDHALTSKVSSHPVEGNSDITDHIQNQLRVGKLRGLVTNHPIQEFPKDRKSATIPDPSAQGRAGIAWEICKGIWTKRQIVTVVTCLEIYPDVAITDMSTKRDSETGEALEIEVSFQQVRRISTKTLKIGASVAPKDMSTSINRQVAVTQDQGRTVGQEVVMDLGEAHISGVAK